MVPGEQFQHFFSALNKWTSGAQARRSGRLGLFFFLENFLEAYKSESNFSFSQYEHSWAGIAGWD